MPSLSEIAKDPALETRILLLRHAETNAPELFHGAESDPGLGEIGRRQANQAAERIARLRPTALYSSGMRRARETAEPIARACDLKPKVVEALHECRMGKLSGCQRSEAVPFYEATRDHWMAGDIDSGYEEGESFRDVRDRVLPAFLELAANHPGETIAIVAHGIVNRILLTSLLKESGPEEFERFGIDFVAVNDLRLRDGHWRAESLNETGELVAT